MEGKKGYFIFDFDFFENIEKENNRQFNCLERCLIAFIKGWKKGYCGSQQTLAAKLGVSLRTINRSISQLLKEGYLTKEGNFLYFNEIKKEVTESSQEEDDEEWLKLMKEYQ